MQDHEIPICFFARNPTVDKIFPEDHSRIYSWITQGFFLVLDDKLIPSIFALYVNGSVKKLILSFIWKFNLLVMYIFLENLPWCCILCHVSEVEHGMTSIIMLWKIFYSFQCIVAYIPLFP